MASAREKKIWSHPELTPGLVGGVTWPLCKWLEGPMDSTFCPSLANLRNGESPSVARKDCEYEVTRD